MPDSQISPETKAYIEQVAKGVEPKVVRYECQGCKRRFKAKTAHNCEGGHWSSPKGWSVVTEP